MELNGTVKDRKMLTNNVMLSWKINDLFIYEKSKKERIIVIFIAKNVQNILGVVRK